MVRTIVWCVVVPLVAGWLAYRAADTAGHIARMGIELPRSTQLALDIGGRLATLAGVGAVAAVLGLGLAPATVGAPSRRPPRVATGLALGLAAAWLELELRIPYDAFVAPRPPLPPGALLICGNALWTGTWAYWAALGVTPLAAVALVTAALLAARHAWRLLRDPPRPVLDEARVVAFAGGLVAAPLLLAGPDVGHAPPWSPVDSRTATTSTLALLVVVAIATARAWLRAEPVSPRDGASGASPTGP
jgi:hypothetical protein